MTKFVVTIKIELNGKSKTVKRSFKPKEVDEIGKVRQWLHDRSQEAANIARQGKMPRGRSYGTFNAGDR